MTKIEAKERARERVSQMTLSEKIGQMRHVAPAIERLGIPAYTWWNECLHGVGRAGTATVFPQPIGMAAAFDPQMMRDVASVISDEARAIHNEALRHGDTGIYKGLTFWTPNINLFRDPRWGRGHETYGEDPFLTSRLAVAFIKGLQGEPKGEEPLKVAACAKHFAVHSGPESLRHSFDANVSRKDLFESYLPAFEAAVREADVAAVMTAYSRLYGEPCCGSPFLLQEILRGEWEFDGHVVSDCGAICDIDAHHRFRDTRPQSAAYAVLGGVDLNCGNAYEHLLVAVEEGLLLESDIDRAVERLFECRFRLGMFDENCSYAQIPFEIVDCESHRELAREVARKSAVLIKNDGMLPMDADIATLAVIGPAAQDVSVLLGNYNGRASRPTTLLQGIQAAVNPMTRVYYAHGCGYGFEKVDEADGTSEAVACAMRAEAVVLCLGLCPAMEGEEGEWGNKDGDRTAIELPEAQLRLYEAVLAVGKPVLVLLTGGSAIAMPRILDTADAVMQVFYPGGEGGAAVADLVFGEDSPSGKMPFTVYEGTQELPPFEDYAMKGRTYRYYEGEALVPFGFGLSYGRFAYGNLKAPERVYEGDVLSLSIVVENLGDVRADEVVQVYLSGEHMSAKRKLVGMQRVTIPAGGVFTVSVDVMPGQLMEVDSEGVKRWIVGTYMLHVGGSQPDTRSRVLGAPRTESRKLMLV